ncbi:Multidrug resistance protein [Pseudonocardia sp. Ae168_Ps1]|uniref:MFS transporter n=1 Tax=unclassified Pseudonocardia TaxID=2619320 RepID=UPI00094B0551|nr:MULTISPECIES: MFS transporter [unclassified Pseudonocardia]OLL73304.1 Multidrug resistance protein [Pseudonocardia sp. Ae150A_Ps1]OLL79283.1 Multidrug resistance protein [Pseudonocardia sp. Ae168_Ps1]OLL86579.1 Multidrug resistance protein [Pseudonocardia sp. Ae263_Ps1]OLL93373.1 Multidrug resistance protein [Pseudonocardia sp. Ae356_Ps1]
MDPTRLDLRHGTQRTFAHLLASTLTVSVVNFTVWFAVTFWVFVETRSVMATGIIAGIFLAATSSTGIWFGSLVDGFGKRAVMQGSAAVSLAIYAGCLVVYLTTPAEVFRDASSPLLWGFVVALMLGVITGNLRTIALPTLVTLLVPAGVRDRANGLVGTATGVSFLVTSVLSGLLVAYDGMRSVLLLALVVLGASLLHLSRVRVPSAPVDAAAGGGDDRGGVDLRGTLRVVGSVPGLPALIVFTCVNNLLGGVFMALMDPYGLSMISVQAWGLLWGALSTGVIVGGLLVARTGLGSRPVRTLLLVNATLWTATMLFPLQASIVLLTIGMTVFMLLMPYAEAAEQTVLQRVVPYGRQGRVFGFAQSVEQAASPLTAFLLAPVTELVVVPFMSDGGADARAIGGWFGTGTDRAIALVFVVTGLLGLMATLAALASRPYRRLSAAYLAAPADDRPPADPDDVMPAGPVLAARTPVAVAPGPDFTDPPASHDSQEP